MVRVEDTVIAKLGRYQGTAETFAAFNNLCGEKFLLEKSDVKIKFNHVIEAEQWCTRMNVAVFPGMRGVVLGDESDSLVAAMPFFRFPEEFYHLFQYIVEGKVYHYKGAWKVSADMDKEGHFEHGFGDGPFQREHFQVWMLRQIGRLENAPVSLDVDEVADRLGGLAVGKAVGVKGV